MVLMAVDTAAKRYSLIGLASPAPRLLPIPDGAIEATGRAMLLFLYAGITLATPAVVVPRAGTITGPDAAGAISGPDAAGAISGPDAAGAIT
jgi:hypothetical protein